MLVPVLLCLIKWWISLYGKLDELHEEMLELISVFDNNGKDGIALGLFFQLWDNHKHVI